MSSRSNHYYRFWLICLLSADTQQQSRMIYLHVVRPLVCCAGLQYTVSEASQISHVSFTSRFMLVYWVPIIFDPEEGGGIFLLTYRLTFTALHGLISQNTWRHNHCHENFKPNINMLMKSCYYVHRFTHTYFMKMSTDRLLLKQQ